jgi:SP family general alpha glucoside:H+ symporter-like MFS transporter
MHSELSSGNLLVPYGFHVYCYGRFVTILYFLSNQLTETGYDTILIGNFYAYPSFAKKYGTYFPLLNEGTGGYQLTAAWQSGIGNASGVGAFFGVMLNGWLVDWFGQKRTLLGSLVLLSALVFITFFAPSIGVLTAGELLCGLPWGVFASSAPAYASEVLPLQLRIYLTSYSNM